MAIPGETIRFSDGAAYDRFMGEWSRRVGERFLEWLAPAEDLDWLDVGCGNGAFTQLVAKHCRPRALQGVDPSEAQLAFARSHPSLQGAGFQLGDAMDLPWETGRFEIAVMPLVIFFVPEPSRGVAEMARVVGPGGTVAAYAWDLSEGGFPYQAVRDLLEERGHRTPMPPSPEASRRTALEELWTGAGLEAIESLEITVQRRFPDFAELWSLLLEGPSSGQSLAGLAEEEREQVQEQLRKRLPTGAGGGITLTGRANAIRGRVPGSPALSLH